MSRSVLTWLVAGVFLMPTSGCSYLSSLFGGGNGQAQGQGQGANSTPQGPSAEEQVLEQIGDKRDASDAAPENVDLATDYASYVYAAATQGIYERAGLDPKERVQWAVEAMQRVDGSDTQLAKARATESVLHEYLGDVDKQGELLLSSYALDPEAGAWEELVTWHGKRGEDDKVVDLCKTRRKALDYGEVLFSALGTCMTARGASSVNSGLDFVSKGDRAWFDAELRRYEAELAAQRAEQERRLAEQRAQDEARRAADAQARADQAQANQANAAAQAASGPVSVTIRNKCRQTVKVFYGDKPKFGSGTYSSMGSNSSTSHSFRPGDMFWIVDDGQNGLGSVTVSQGMREIEILDSCTGVRTR